MSEALLSTSREGYRRIFRSCGSRFAASVLSPTETYARTPRYFISPRVADPCAVAKHRWRQHQRRRRQRLGVGCSPLHGAEDQGFPDPKIIGSSEVAPIAQAAARDKIAAPEFWRQLCEKLRTSRDIVCAGDLVASLDALVTADYRHTDLLKLLTRELLDDLHTLSPTEQAVAVNAYAHFNAESRPLLRAVVQAQLALATARQGNYHADLFDLRSASVLLGALARFSDPPVPGARELASALLEEAASAVLAGAEKEAFADVVGIIGACARLGAIGAHDRVAAGAVLRALAVQVEEGLRRMQRKTDKDSDGKLKPLVSVYDDPERSAVTNEMRRAQGLPELGVKDPKTGEVRGLSLETQEKIDRAVHGRAEDFGASPNFFVAASALVAAGAFRGELSDEVREVLARECQRFLKAGLATLRPLEAPGDAVRALGLPRAGPAELRPELRGKKTVRDLRSSAAAESSDEEEEDDEVIFGDKDRALSSGSEATPAVEQRSQDVLRKEVRRQRSVGRVAGFSMEDLMARNRLASRVGMAAQGLRKVSRGRDLLPAEAELVGWVSAAVEAGIARGFTAPQVVACMELLGAAGQPAQMPALSREGARKFGNMSKAEIRRTVKALRDANVAEELWVEFRQCCVAFT